MNPRPTVLETVALPAELYPYAEAGLRQAAREVKGFSQARHADRRVPVWLPRAVWGRCSDEETQSNEEPSGKNGARGLDLPGRQRRQPVQSVTDIAAEFAARPWQAVGEAELGPAATVPTMLTPEEGRLYHWLGRRVAGDGATVDLGAYAGGSAARLLSGLARSGRAFHVHSYDRFRSSRAFWAKYIPDEPPPDSDDADLLPLVRRHLAPWEGHVTLHVGDIAERDWTGGPIEILSVDAAKGAALADHIAAAFYPSLVPGRGVLIQQDYLMAVQPWLPAQMVALSDCFVPLAHVPRVGVVFLSVARVTAEALDAARVGALSDGKLMSRVRQAAKWHEGMIDRKRFKAMLDQIRANPGVRLGWQMKQAGRERQASR